MTSVVLNNPSQPICFHVACDGLGENDKQNLDKFSLLYKNVRVMVYNAAPLVNEIKKVQPAQKYMEEAAFLRVFLPLLLPQNIEKIIYMDADTLCIGALGELWEAELGENIIGAVFYEKADAHLQWLNLKSGDYFSSGVMVIDLAKWRQSRITQKIAEFQQNIGQDFYMLTGDAINSVLSGKAASLPPKFNSMIEAYNPLFDDIKANTAVLHFVNEGKPWQKYTEKWVENLYWSYVRRSLWFYIEPEEPWEIKTVFMAGKNAELSGNYKDAAYYLGQAANRLLDYYIEHQKKENDENA
jgi:lipopolysaccharide biosynthesis glycosyltransferase